MSLALGRRKLRQEELFIATAELPRGLGHPFSTKLNAVLAEAQFDGFVEALCAPYYTNYVNCLVEVKKQG